ncbi:mRNA interferase [Campylobacterota bacterium]|nr:mRNA interferase [Campylobacterota bacterium]
MVKARRFEVWLINLDPTIGREIKKTRPCLVVSPAEMDALQTVIIAPLTSSGFAFPMRVNVNFDEKAGFILLDQLRSVDRTRLVKKLGQIDTTKAQEVCTLLQQMFAF